MFFFCIHEKDRISAGLMVSHTDMVVYYSGAASGFVTAPAMMVFPLSGFSSRLL